MRKVWQRLIAFLLRLKQHLVDPAPLRSLETLPPYLSALASLNERLRLYKVFGIGCLAFASVVLVLQEVRVLKMTHDFANKDYLIVPGAPEFMRIRPGFIDAQSVYLFSEYIASQLGTFSYASIEYQYKTLSEYMTPELKSTFLMDANKKFQMYKDLRVDEIFDYVPVKSFDLKEDEGGSKYVVQVVGSTKRYVEGNLREHIPREIIRIEFRTTKIKPNTPWFFKIHSLERVTPQEAENFEKAKSL